jgi:hypothetical protein
VLVEAVALGEQLVEVGAAEHGAQRRLSDLRVAGANASIAVTAALGSTTRK